VSGFGGSHMLAIPLSNERCVITGREEFRTEEESLSVGRKVYLRTLSWGISVKKYEPVERELVINGREEASKIRG